MTARPHAAMNVVAEKSDKDILTYVVAAGLMAGILVIDIVTPLGFAEWALYLLPVGVMLFQRRPLAAFMAAAATSLLNVAGFLMSPAGADVSMAIVNRGMGMLSLWMLAAVIWQVLQARARLHALNWVQRGEAEVSQVLLGEQAPEDLARQALRALCGYVGAQVGVLYRLEDRVLLRTGGQAVDEQSAPARVEVGQGLLGEVARDGRARLVRDVPPGHLSLSSGLGRSDPAHLLVVPLSANGVVCGVLELGFVQAGDETLERAREVLDATAPSIGIALRSALDRRQLEALLAKTQQQSEELQAQQEELRVSNEELEEQSRVLQASQAQLETQQLELEQSNVQLEETAQALQRQKQDLLETQTQLRANAAQLEAASRYKSEFLANMSHELRTPLNSSLILSKLLADNREGTLTPEQVQYANTIHASNNDLLALINDILDLSKIEAGHVEVQPEPVPLRDVVERLRAMFEPLAQQRGLGFSVDIAPSAPEMLLTDPLRLQQVLKNLLANALKFTEKGQVSLTARSQQSGRLQFDVRDTGVGIAREQQAVIFEAFRQADGSTSRRFGGTGLGLSISRELARRLGGDISVDSEPGRGSTFTFELPAELSATPEGTAAAPQRHDAPAAALHAAPVPPSPAATPTMHHAPATSLRAEPVATWPEEAAGTAARAPEPFVPRRPGRLLLTVEDDVRFAGVLRQLAEEMDFDCVVAPTAAEGLRLARELQPGAMLLDVVLPDASGLSVLEQLKRDPATRHIPVHMMSVHERAQPALELGAVGYVLKPAAREELVAAIDRLEQRLQQTVRQVLIVEDDAKLRESLMLLLGGDHVAITTAGTVAEALEHLRSRTFDCMVMDLALPDRSGYELLEELAQSEQHAFPPVIVYTGRALSRDEEQRLRRYSKSIIVKGARSPERLLDEVTLFLHSVETTLPADQQRLLRQARRRDAVLDGRRLLLAEDDVRNIFALTSVFEPLGAKLEIARNGREAIERLERGDIDLVLMDIMMPEMDGLTAMRHIRAQPRWAHVPIIALTAKAMADDREQCLEAGANDYIAKPIDADKLVSLARVWCPK